MNDSAYGDFSPTNTYGTQSGGISSWDGSGPHSNVGYWNCSDLYFECNQSSQSNGFNESYNDLGWNESYHG